MDGFTAVVIAVIVGLFIAIFCFINYYSSSNTIERTITLYDNNGEIVQKWDGDIYVERHGDQVYFDNQGRKGSISGGIVVVEDK